MDEKEHALESEANAHVKDWRSQSCIAEVTTDTLFLGKP